MVTDSQSTNTYRVLFFGSLGVMSYATLLGLLKRKVNVVAVVIPGVKPGDNATDKPLANIPIIQTPKHDTIELLALQHNIPIIYVQHLDKMESYSQIKQSQADFIFVSCFPYILPSTIWRLPTIASLNVHPSLLPAYRGPHPLFWQLKKGEHATGVTVHLVDEVIDGGDVVIQKPLPLKNGLRDRAINTQVGELGAKLLGEVIKLYHHQRVEPQKQNPESASYMSSPRPEDFRLSTHWTAQHAFNFMRGTEDWKFPYHVQIGGTNLRLEAAIAYSPVGSLEGEYRIDGEYVTVRFAHGVLKAYSSNPLDA